MGRSVGRGWRLGAVGPVVVGLVLALVAPVGAGPVDPAPGLEVTTTVLPLLDVEGIEPNGNAHDVNDRGQVVGQSSFQPVLWQRGEVIQLMESDPVLGGSAVQINDRGQVLVRSDRRLYLWFRGRVTELHGSPEATSFTGRHLNERGQVLGGYSPGDGGRDVSGVWETDGTFVPILPPDGYDVAVADLSDNGYVAGTLTSRDGSVRRPFLWRHGRFAWIGESGISAAVNQRGQVVGIRADAETGPFGVAVLWYRGEEVPLGLPAGDLPTPISNAVDINDRGQVIGITALSSQETMAYRWDDGELVDLGTAGGPPIAPTRINERGQVVGFFQVGNELRDFFWDRGDLVELGHGLGPDALNDRGQAVGNTVVDGLSRPVLWTVH